MLIVLEGGKPENQENNPQIEDESQPTSPGVGSSKDPKTSRARKRTRKAHENLSGVSQNA